MSSIVSLAAAAAVLLHTMLGCCMHHGQRCANDMRALIGSAPIAAACCAHHHGTPPDPRADEAVSNDQTSRDGQGSDRRQVAPTMATESGSLPGESTACEGETCSFISSDAGGVQLPRAVANHWLADLSTNCDGTGSPSSAIGSAAGGLPPAADRSQPRLCVWRI